jgi:integrase
LEDLEKTERQKAQSAHAVVNGKMTFGEALAVFKARVQASPSIKPRTKEYYGWRIPSLLKSWPELEGKDVSRITSAECLDWSVKNASQNCSSSHNFTVSILRRVFAVAIEAGARYENPALSAQRIKHRTGERLQLPKYGQFEQLAAKVRDSGSGFAKPATELLQFLAYGGMRIGEAKHVTWGNCDFKRGEIIVRGNPRQARKTVTSERCP